MSEARSNKKRLIWGISSLAALACCAFPAIFLRGCMTDHSRSVGHGDLKFDVSRDGNLIVFTGEGQGQRDIYLFNRRDGSTRNLTKSLEYEVAPSLSPEAKSIVFTRGRKGVRADQLCTLDIETGRVTQWTDADENVSSPVFTPDGRSILYALETEYGWGGLASNWQERGQFKIMNLATKRVEPYLTSREASEAPTYSRDGQHFAFVSDRGIVLEDKVSGKERILVKGGKSPAFGSDGKQIAYVTGTYIPDFHVELQPIAGGAPVKVPNTTGAMQVCFAGAKLLVLREVWESGGIGVPTRSLWEMNLDGSNARVIIPTRSFQGK